MADQQITPHAVRRARQQLEALDLGATADRAPLVGSDPEDADTAA